MINWKDWKTYICLLIPIITGYLASMVCEIGKDAGTTVPSRPPAWVFATVWPLLYLCLGLAWVIIRNQNSYIIDILMSLTVLGLVSWILMYGCGKNKKKRFIYSPISFSHRSFIIRLQLDTK